MDSNIEYDIKVTLNLNWQEALWLKALVQNPICESESVPNHEMRMKVWKALENVPNSLGGIRK